MVAVSSPVTKYADAVRDGRIVAGKWVRLACERHLNDLATGPARGLRFDEDAAQRAIDFFGFLHHSKGEWAGRVFKLGSWQEFVVGSLFGWQREYGRCPQCSSWLPLDPATLVIDCRACFAPDDEEDQIPAEKGWFRRFRTSFVSTGRKSGKSTLAAGVGLLLAFFDEEPGAEVYASATKRDQAKIMWGEAQRMVKSSPDLRGDIKVLVGNLHAGDSKFMPLGADEDSTDGLNIHGNLVDELHAHKTRAMWDVLITAMGSRRQPLTFVVTTAGSDRTSICWEQHELGEQVVSGVIDDDSYFVYIAAIDEEDDWRDPECWAKANPNLGVSVKLEYLLTQCAQAEHSPAKQNTFQRLHCNRWTQQVDRWIDIDLWDSQHGSVDVDQLKGRVCYGGLDLSASADLTAWVLLFPRDDDPDEIDVLARFWCPEDRLNDPANRYADQYRVWKDEGWLTTTPEAVIDLERVGELLAEDMARFRVASVNLDVFQGYYAMSALMVDELGAENVARFVPSFKNYGSPMVELSRRLLGRKVHHGGNPILRWMADNLEVRQAPDGSLKPVKPTQKSGQGKIDGIVALIMALDRLMLHEPEEEIRFYA